MEQTEKSPVDLSNWSSPLPGRVSIKSKPDAPRAYRGSTKTHQGVDIPAAPGTDVLAIGDGKVYYVRRGWVPGAGKGQEAGNFVIVDHGNGLRSEYMHLSDITVERGQMVRGGTAIAKSG